MTAVTLNFPFAAETDPLTLPLHLTVTSARKQFHKTQHNTGRRAVLGIIFYHDGTFWKFVDLKMRENICVFY